MGSAINANVCVQNNFGFAANITLTHQFSSNAQQSWTWDNVQAGATTPTGVATGNTGSGWDYWTMTVEGLDPSGEVWSHLSTKRCTLESADNGQTITMAVSPNGWTLPLPSGACSTSLSMTSTTIGALVAVINSFSLPATITLTHQFSNNPTTQSWTWANVGVNMASWQAYGWATAIGATTSGWDYWTVSITLTNGQVWTNSGQKRCTLEAADMDQEIQMDVSPSGWTLPLPSGGCSTSLSQNNG